MARRRRDLAESELPVDAEGDFRRLRRLGMAADPPLPAAGALRREAELITARGGPPGEQLESLWEALEGLGLREAGERHLAAFPARRP